jgi:ATP-dependent helicase HrpB
VVDAARQGRNVVLVAPPGAGKTTRVPPALADARQGRLVMLEPRRVAARAATRRIASENGWTVGREVGYQIRFERRFEERTPIVVVTEGILVRWLQADPFLDGIATLVFDEFHERTLAADLALAMARQLQRQARPDLCLVAMSATLQSASLAAFLDAERIESAGRAHRVDIEHVDGPPQDERPLEARVASVVRAELRRGDGDILVFLPGVGEIRRVGDILRDGGGDAFDVLPLHGELPGEEQDRALAPSPVGRRRVVLATNVAETSVTVAGVRSVVDSGLVRTLRFDPTTGLDSLVLGRVSRASADQRAGRAGREAPGRCVRLWNAADDRALAPFEKPEVQRVDLAGPILELLAWGERDPAAFPWFEAPEPARIEAAAALLGTLGAVDANGLTAMGRRMAALPLAPRLARLAIEGERLGVRAEAAEIAALLAERRPRARPPASRIARSDLLLERDGLEGATRARVRELAKRIERDLSPDLRSQQSQRSREDGDERALLRAIAAGYPDRVARKRSTAADEERAVLVGGRGVRLARESAVRGEELFVALDLDDRGADAWVRTASAVERDWLPREALTSEDVLRFDETRGRVVAWRRTTYRDLTIDERELPIAPDKRPEAEALLLAAARERPLEVLPFDDPDLASLRARWLWLREAAPQWNLPACDESALLELLPALVAGAKSLADLRRAPFGEALLGALSHAQRQALAREAPERIAVPSGSELRLDYEPGRPPILAVRIQELFGLAETPRVAGGKVPVLLHLLAPSGRPQQVTQDLASFWKNTYPQVKKELAARYPKHAWPDDPARAVPRRRPVRRGSAADR